MSTIQANNKAYVIVIFFLIRVIPNNVTDLLSNIFIFTLNLYLFAFYIEAFKTKRNIHHKSKLAMLHKKAANKSNVLLRDLIRQTQQSMN